ncbi:MAG: glycoside hydrolase family 15 protein [Myxococcales bacterium]
MLNQASSAQPIRTSPSMIDAASVGFLTPRIEDHALVGNLRTAALITLDGTVDWLCFPNFDSDACFAALLGTEDHGCWKIFPRLPVLETKRSYRGDSLILDTEWTTESGVVRISDFMPPGEHNVLVRIVECIKGRVPMCSRAVVRFGYGQVVPLVEARDTHTAIYAGPDALYLESDLDEHAPATFVDFEVEEGDRVSFMLSHAGAYEHEPKPGSAARSERETVKFWRQWTSKLQVPEQHRDLLMRSFITLKACTFEPTGGIVAAPTTSLPEEMGGERNWDYRFCWLRDASLSVLALQCARHNEEGLRLGAWMRRAVAGDPSQFQIMYGLRGERRLTELSLDWLPGYGDSLPVRTGNGAYTQFQLDVMGEVALGLYWTARLRGKVDPQMERAFISVGNYVSLNWTRMDRGLWEMRGPDRPFTASKVSAWHALECCIRAARAFGLDAPTARWHAVQKEIHAEVCEKGFDKGRNTFTQYYGSQDLDASLLFVPLTGFLPPDDPRCIGTVDAVAKDLMEDGLLLRYRPKDGNDGLRGREGAFLACSFWLVQAYCRIGRRKEAEALFSKLAALCNDVGLLAEEYDPKEKRQLGNFPQAFSHLALIQAAFSLDDADGGSAL